MKKLALAAMAVTVVACSPGQEASTSAVGDWTVEPAQSRVSFVTVKNAQMGESHYFRVVNGQVSADGAARFAVDLASLETRTDIRNERMRDHLFSVATYPEAVITAQLDPAQFQNLAVDQRRTAPISFTLDLHGAQAEYDAEVFVTRISNDSVLVETTEPIQVFAEDFNMLEGLEVLRGLASLNSIQPVAPVTFSILLTR